MLAVDPFKKNGEICNKIFSFKNISGENIFFGFSPAGYFSRKFISDSTLSGHTGPNDTDLESIWPPGAKSMAVDTDRIRIL